MDEASKRILFGQIRTVLAAMGGILVTHGYLSSGASTEILGAITAIIPAAWSAWSKFQAEAAAKAREAIAVNVGIKIADSTVGPTPTIPAASVPAVIEAVSMAPAPPILASVPARSLPAPVPAAAAAPVVALAANFDVFFERLIGIEGGYTDGAGDPGGETNWGISKRSYPDLNIKDLTREAAKEIYRRDFWLAAHMDQFDPAISFQVLDFAINSGIDTAIRKLQIAVGVADDGRVGPLTLVAIKALRVSSITMLFVAARLDYMTRLPNWPSAGRGWARRAAKDLQYAAADTVN